MALVDFLVGCIAEAPRQVPQAAWLYSLDVVAAAAAVTAAVGAAPDAAAVALQPVWREAQEMRTHSVSRLAAGSALRLLVAATTLGGRAVSVIALEPGATPTTPRALVLASTVLSETAASTWLAAVTAIAWHGVSPGVCSFVVAGHAAPPHAAAAAAAVACLDTVAPTGNSLSWPAGWRSEEAALDPPTAIAVHGDGRFTALVAGSTVYVLRRALKPTEAAPRTPLSLVAESLVHRMPVSAACWRREPVTGPAPLPLPLLVAPGLRGVAVSPAVLLVTTTAVTGAGTAAAGLHIWRESDPWEEAAFTPVVSTTLPSPPLVTLGEGGVAVDGEGDRSWAASWVQQQLRHDRLHWAWGRRGIAVDPTGFDAAGAALPPFPRCAEQFRGPLAPHLLPPLELLLPHDGHWLAALGSVVPGHRGSEVGAGRHAAPSLDSAVLLRDSALHAAVVHADYALSAAIAHDVAAGEPAALAVTLWRLIGGRDLPHKHASMTSCGFASLQLAGDAVLAAAVSPGCIAACSEVAIVAATATVDYRAAGNAVPSLSHVLGASSGEAASPTFAAAAQALTAVPPNLLCRAARATRRTIVALAGGRASAAGDGASPASVTALGPRSVSGASSKLSAYSAAGLAVVRSPMAIPSPSALASSAPVSVSAGFIGDDGSAGTASPTPSPPGLTAASSPLPRGISSALGSASGGSYEFTSEDVGSGGRSTLYAFSSGAAAHGRASAAPLPHAHATFLRLRSASSMDSAGPAAAPPTATVAAAADIGKRVYAAVGGDAAPGAGAWSAALERATASSSRLRTRVAAALATAAAYDAMDAPLTDMIDSLRLNRDGRTLAWVPMLPSAAVGALQAAGVDAHDAAAAPMLRDPRASAWWLDGTTVMAEAASGDAEDVPAEPRPRTRRERGAPPALGIGPFAAMRAQLSGGAGAGAPATSPTAHSGASTGSGDDDGDDEDLEEGLTVREELLRLRDLPRVAVRSGARGTCARVRCNRMPSTTRLTTLLTLRVAGETAGASPSSAAASSRIVRVVAELIVAWTGKQGHVAVTSAMMMGVPPPPLPLPLAGTAPAVPVPSPRSDIFAAAIPGLQAAPALSKRKPQHHPDHIHACLLFDAPQRAAVLLAHLATCVRRALVWSRVVALARTVKPRSDHPAGRESARGTSSTRTAAAHAPLLRLRAATALGDLSELQLLEFVDAPVPRATARSGAADGPAEDGHGGASRSSDASENGGEVTVAGVLAAMGVIAAADGKARAGADGDSSGLLRDPPPADATARFAVSVPPLPWAQMMAIPRGAGGTAAANAVVSAPASASGEGDATTSGGDEAPALARHAWDGLPSDDAIAGVVAATPLHLLRAWYALHQHTQRLLPPATLGDAGAAAAAAASPTTIDGTATAANPDGEGVAGSEAYCPRLSRPDILLLLRYLPVVGVHGLTRTEQLRLQALVAVVADVYDVRWREVATLDEPARLCMVAATLARHSHEVMQSQAVATQVLPPAAGAGAGAGAGAASPAGSLDDDGGAGYVPLPSECRDRDPWRLNDVDVLAAAVSETQDTLLALMLPVTPPVGVHGLVAAYASSVARGGGSVPVPPAAPDATPAAAFPTWTHVRQLQLPVWLRSDEALREVVDRVARAMFTVSRRDPFAAALPYLVQGLSKLPLLRNLFRLSTTGAKVYTFLGGDFTAEGPKRAASKNAFALLGQHRWYAGMAFFLLAGKPGHAIKTATMQLHDSLLALLIARLVRSQRLPFGRIDVVGALTAAAGEVEAARTRLMPPPVPAAGTAVTASSAVGPTAGSSGGPSAAPRGNRPRIAGLGGGGRGRRGFGFEDETDTAPTSTTTLSLPPTAATATAAAPAATVAAGSPLPAGAEVPPLFAGAPSSLQLPAADLDADPVAYTLLTEWIAPFATRAIVRSALVRASADWAGCPSSLLPSPAGLPACADAEGTTGAVALAIGLLLLQRPLDAVAALVGAASGAAPAVPLPVLATAAALLFQSQFTRRGSALSLAVLLRAAHADGDAAALVRAGAEPAHDRLRQQLEATAARRMLLIDDVMPVTAAAGDDAPLLVRAQAASTCELVEGASCAAVDMAIEMAALALGGEWRHSRGRITSSGGDGGAGDVDWSSFGAVAVEADGEDGDGDGRRVVVRLPSAAAQLPFSGESAVLAVATWRWVAGAVMSRDAAAGAGGGTTPGEPAAAAVGLAAMVSALLQRSAATLAVTLPLRLRLASGDAAMVQPQELALAALHARLAAGGSRLLLLAATAQGREASPLSPLPTSLCRAVAAVAWLHHTLAALLMREWVRVLELAWGGADAADGDATTTIRPELVVGSVGSAPVWQGSTAAVRPDSTPASPRQLTLSLEAAATLPRYLHRSHHLTACRVIWEQAIVHLSADGGGQSAAACAPVAAIVPGKRPLELWLDAYLDSVSSALLAEQAAAAVVPHLRAAASDAHVRDDAAVPLRTTSDALIAWASAAADHLMAADVALHPQLGSQLASRCDAAGLPRPLLPDSHLSAAVLTPRWQLSDVWGSNNGPRAHIITALTGLPAPSAHGAGAAAAAAASSSWWQDTAGLFADAPAAGEARLDARELVWAALGGPGALWLVGTERRAVARALARGGRGFLPDVRSSPAPAGSASAGLRFDVRPRGGPPVLALSTIVQPPQLTGGRTPLGPHLPARVAAAQQPQYAGGTLVLAAIVDAGVVHAELSPPPPPLPALSASADGAAPSPRSIGRTSSATSIGFLALPGSGGAAGDIAAAVSLADSDGAGAGTIAAARSTSDSGTAARAVVQPPASPAPHSVAASVTSLGRMMAAGRSSLAHQLREWIAHPAAGAGHTHGHAQPPPHPPPPPPPSASVSGHSDAAAAATPRSDAGAASTSAAASLSSLTGAGIASSIARWLPTVSTGLGDQHAGTSAATAAAPTRSPWTQARGSPSPATGPAASPRAAATNGSPVRPVRDGGDGGSGSGAAPSRSAPPLRANTFLPPSLDMSRALPADLAACEADATDGASGEQTSDAATRRDGGRAGSYFAAPAASSDEAGGRRMTATAGTAVAAAPPPAPIPRLTSALSRATSTSSPAPHATVSVLPHDRYEYAMPFTAAPTCLAHHPSAPLYARGGPRGTIAVCSFTLEPATAGAGGGTSVSSDRPAVQWHRCVHGVVSVLAYQRLGGGGVAASSGATLDAMTLDEMVTRIAWTRNGASVVASFASGVVRVWDAGRADAPTAVLSTSGSHSLGRLVLVPGAAPASAHDAASPAAPAGGGGMALGSAAARRLPSPAPPPPPSHYVYEREVWGATDVAPLTLSHAVVAATAAPVVPYGDPAAGLQGVSEASGGMSVAGWGLHVFDLRTGTGAGGGATVATAARYGSNGYLGCTALWYDDAGLSIVAGCEDGGLFVYDVRGGRVRTRVAGVPTRAVRRVTTALPPPPPPQSSAAATSIAGDGSREPWVEWVPVWGHMGPISVIAPHPSGRVFGSGGLDGEVKLWSASPALHHSLSLTRLHAASPLASGVMPAACIASGRGSSGGSGSGAGGMAAGAGPAPWLHNLWRGIGGGSSVDAALGGVSSLLLCEDGVVSGGWDGGIAVCREVW